MWHDPLPLDADTVDGKLGFRIVLGRMPVLDKVASQIPLRNFRGGEGQVITVLKPARTVAGQKH